MGDTYIFGPTLDDLYTWGIYELPLGYIAYGYSSVGGAHRLVDCDEYNTYCDSWSAKTNGPNPARNNPSAAVLNDKMYCAFGKDNSTELQDNDEYNPDTWTSKTSGPSPARNGQPTHMYADEKLYVAGGHDGGSHLTDNDEYNPDTWTARTNISSPARRFHAGLSLNELIYSAGGRSAAEDKMDDVDKYTPSGDSWSAMGNLPEVRRIMSPISVQQTGKGYCIGGLDSGANYTNDTLEYNPDTWTAKTAALYASSESRGFAVGNKVYNCGGFNTVYVADIDEYDVSGDSWTAKTDGDETRGYMATGAIA